MKNFDSQLSAASEVASKVTYTGAGTGLVGGIAKIDWVSWVGLAVAVGGLLTNIYFKWREDRRQHELSKLKKQRLQGGYDHE